MESSPSPQNPSQSLDPELLAALTKLADGCDGLRRWALTAGTKNSTHDPASFIDAIDKSTSQIEDITEASNPADTTQIEDRPAEDNTGDDVPTNHSLPECSTITLRQEPGSGAEPCDNQCNVNSSIGETSSRSESSDVVSDARKRAPRGVYEVVIPAQEMKEAFLQVMESHKRAREEMLRSLSGLSEPNWTCARDEIEKTWPQDGELWRHEVERPFQCFPRFSKSDGSQSSSENGSVAIRSWHFSRITTSVLPVDFTALFFRIFLSCHMDSNILHVDEMEEMKEIVSNALALIRCIQRPSPINLPHWEVSHEHHMVWSLRACRSRGPYMQPARPQAVGFRLHREQGWIGSTNRRKGFPILEWRSTTCAYTVVGAQSAVGSVVSWVDNHGESIYHKRVSPCGKDGGTYVAFFESLIEASHAWYEVWTGTLDMIDTLVSVKPSDTLNKDHWQTLMFDSEFQVSETYFSVLQMLRIFNDWIEETEAEWPNIYGRVMRSYQYMTEERVCGPPTSHIIIRREELKKNILEIETNLKSLAARLRTRIEKKRAEVESLRDGLFNAASLREAVNARTLNLFVIIFTVVTIIYTPLGFLAALWAMSNLSSKLDGDKDAPTPTSFIASWIVLPLGTYLASTIFLFVAWVNTSPDGGSFWLRANHKMTDLSKRFKSGHFKFKFDRIKHVQQQLKEKQKDFWSKTWKRQSGADVERGHHSHK